MDRAAVARGAAWVSFFNFVAKVVFPLGTLFITRKLGPAVVGAFALIQMTIEISDVIRDAGLTQNYLVEKELDHRKEATYAGLSLLTGLVPAVLVLLLTIPMANFFHQPEYLYALPFAALCLVFSALGTVPNARMLRKADLKRQGTYGIVAGGAGLLLTLFLVRGLGMGFPALVIQMVFASVLSLVLVLRVEPLPGLRASREDAKALFKRSRALLGANLLNNLFLLSDVFVIKRLVGDVAVGYYNTAQNIGYKPFHLITQPLGRTLQIAFSQSAGDIPKLARAYYRALAAVVLFVLPIYVFIGFGSPTIVLVLLGEKFRGDIPVLSVLCLYLAFRTVGNISGNALVPAGKHAWTLYPWYGALAVTGAGVWWASRAPTLMNLVWAYVAGALVVYTAIAALAVRFIPGDRELYLRVGRAAAVSVLTSLLIAGLFQIPIVHWGRFLLAFFVGGAVHLLLVGRVYGVPGLRVFSKEGVKSVWRSL